MWGFASRLVGGDVAFGLLHFTATEQEFLHLGAEELACLGVERVEAVFVEQHGLVGHPLLPGLLGNLSVDALAERAGPGGEVEAFGVDVELGAMDGATHAFFLLPALG